jgi:hypothetical protein
VRVQVVRNNMPPSHARVALNRAADVGQEVCFGASWSDRGADDFPSDDIEIDHERQRAVADVLELPSLHLAWSQRQAGRGSLQGLDTRQLIGADHPFAGGHARWRLSIRGTHVGDLLSPLFGRLVGGGRQPIPNQVWLEIGCF